MAAARRVADDTVKYYLFPKLPENSSPRTELEKRLDSYITKLFHLLKDYIWQDEPFNLAVVDAQRDGMPVHLEGTTYFGDNVEDEWFVVYLLLQLTKEDEDLVVKVEDTDGEFILIEAADHLPKWLNPETSENRVFLYRGALHIVCPENAGASSRDIATPTVEGALASLRQSPNLSTRATPAIQKALLARLEELPGQHGSRLHRAHCYLPAAAVAVLNRDPQLVGPAVGAFMTRDPLDLKVLRAMRNFPPETRVMAEVRLTRCLYAQLRQQRFVPDRRVGWKLPPAHSPEFVAHDLGVKLACGLEILANGAVPAASSASEQTTEIADDVRWKRFLKSLSAKGYFQGELQGSKLYHELQQKAKEYFLQTVASADDDRSRSSSAAGVRLTKLLRDIEVNVEKMKEDAKHLSPPDDEKWMEITPEDLDRLLDSYASRSDQETIRNAGDKAGPQEEHLGSEITQGLRKFVQHVSDYEGAELPAGKNKKPSNGARVDFDADSFGEAVSAILDFRLPPSDDDSSSSMSSYGDEIDSHRRSVDLGDDSDEEEEEDDGSRHGARNPAGLSLDMQSYMDLMDQELAHTNVGLSFEREQPSPGRTSTSKAKKRAPCAVPESADEEADDEAETGDDYRPVDVDLTALKNILESYSSQEGLPGPASNLLSAMGIRLPRDSGDS